MTLLAHYKLNSDATDSSGSGLNLTAGAGVTYATGIVGNAASLDGGATDTLTRSALSALGITGTWTIFLRFNATAVNAAQVLVSNYVGSSNRLSVAIRADGKASITKNDGASTAKSATISAATWYDLFFLCSSGTISGYLCATASPADTAMTGTDAGGLSSSAAFELGSRNAGTSLLFAGLIDDVRIYDTLLTQDQRVAVRADRSELPYPWLKSGRPGIRTGGALGNNGILTGAAI